MCDAAATTHVAAIGDKGADEWRSQRAQRSIKAPKRHYFTPSHPSNLGKAQYLRRYDIFVKENIMITKFNSFIDINLIFRDQNFIEYY